MMLKNMGLTSAKEQQEENLEDSDADIVSNVDEIDPEELFEDERKASKNKEKQKAKRRAVCNF
jgi:hypothetical protein